MGISFSYVNPFQVVFFFFFGPLEGQVVRRFSDALNPYPLTQYMDLTFIHSSVVMVSLMTLGRHCFDGILGNPCCYHSFEQ